MSSWLGYEIEKNSTCYTDIESGYKSLFNCIIGFIVLLGLVTLRKQVTSKMLAWLRRFQKHRSLKLAF